jgi:hypothetical protein
MGANNVPVSVKLDSSRFLLYYSTALQSLLCLYIFNPKMEWIVLVSIFFVMIIYGFGLISSINKGSPFVTSFVNLDLIVRLGSFIPGYKDMVLKYIIALPLVLNLISVKLVSNYEGNKRLSSNKQFARRMTAMKTLFCINVLLFALIAIFGFPLEGITYLQYPMVALFALPVSLLLSMVQLVISGFIFDAY